MVRPPLALLLLCGALIVPAHAAESFEIAPLVYLHVSIKDKNRIFVRDLQKEEVTVTVDGVPQKIEHVFAERVPTVYAVLIDIGPAMSTAMRNTLYPTLLEYVQSFLLNVLDHRRDEEGYTLATYYRDTRWIMEPTSDEATITDTIVKLRAGETSLIRPLNEDGSVAGKAIEEAVLKLRRRGEMRKAILLFGHTIDQDSLERLPRLKQLIADNNIDLYVVTFASKVSGTGFSLPAQQTPFFYRSLALATGGELYEYAGYADRLHRQVGDYVARLHTLWTVAFRLTGLEPAERPRKVEVRIRRPTSRLEYKKEIVY